MGVPGMCQRYVWYLSVSFPLKFFHEIMWLKGHKVWLMYVCMQFDGYHNEPHHNWESSNLLCKHVN